MSAPINQKEYLKRYLSGPSNNKKKKKKKITKGKGLVIIDDDVDLSKIRPLEGDELDILGDGEDAPQIAGIIDERPEEVKKLEQFKTSSKWRVINQDDGFNSKVSIEEIKRDIKEQEKENELVFGKMYSDSEDEKNNGSDLSPPRIKPKSNEEKSKVYQANSDSDISPPRKNYRESKNERQGQKQYESRCSTQRKNEHSPRRKKEQSPQRKKAHSPKRRNEPSHSHRRSNENTKSKERLRKPSRWGEADDQQSTSSQRHETRTQKYSDSDQSPPRKSRKKSPSLSRERDNNKRKRNESPKRKRNKSSDSDISPPKKNKSIKDSVSKTHKNRRNSNDSDLSPPRRKESKKDRSKSTDSDLSPQRKHSKNRYSERSIRNSSDSDQSPPRRQNNVSKKSYRQNSDSPPPSNKKMARTLEGKMAGLQNASELRKENDDFRRKEDAVFSRMTDDLSGRNAKAVSRKSNKRETSEERRKLKEKQEIQKMIDEKYKKWSKGIKQVQDAEARTADFLHESSKPLARSAGDQDLERTLKQVDREGDPMLEYLREKRRERGDLAPEKPTYKGNFPPNRFNIRPGYRWDGVDRSNGYEQKYFDNQSKKRAEEEEYYKWCSADM